MLDKNQENAQKFIELLNGDDSVAFIEFIKSMSSSEVNTLINKVIESDAITLIFINAKMEDHFSNYKNIVSKGELK